MVVSICVEENISYSIHAMLKYSINFWLPYTVGCIKQVCRALSYNGACVQLVGKGYFIYSIYTIIISSIIIQTQLLS